MLLPKQSYVYDMHKLINFVYILQQTCKSLHLNVKVVAPFISDGYVYTPTYEYCTHARF